jgi:hypothetical protein
MADAKKYSFETEFEPSEIIKTRQLTPKRFIKKPDLVLGVYDNGVLKPLFTRQSFSLLIGRAKARKTFLTTMISSACMKGELYEKFKTKVTSHIVIFDTEQSDYYANMSYQRSLLLGGNLANRLVYLPIKPYSPAERLIIINHYFEVYNPDIAIIDGVRDLVYSINDENEATETTTQIYKWVEFKNCHIVLILHQNKGDNNARGHLGTELVNKAETVLSIVKEPGANVSTVTAEYMRGEEIEPFQFEIVDNLPVICGKEFNYENLSEEDDRDLIF